MMVRLCAVFTLPEALFLDFDFFPKRPRLFKDEPLTVQKDTWFFPQVMTSLLDTPKQIPMTLFFVPLACDHHPLRPGVDRDRIIIVEANRGNAITVSTRECEMRYSTLVKSNKVASVFMLSLSQTRIFGFLPISPVATNF